MARLNQLGLSILTNFIAQGVAIVLAIIATPYYINYLGTLGYGIYSFLIVVISYLAFLDIGMNAGAVKYIAEAFGKKDMVRLRLVIGSISRIYLVSGSIGAVVLFSGASFIAKNFLKGVPVERLSEITFFLQLGGISFFLNMFNIFVSGIPTAIQKQYLSNSVRLIGDSVRYLLAILILTRNGGLIELAIVNIFVNLSVLIANYIISRRELGHFSLFRPFEWKVLKEISSFSVFIMLGSIIGVITLQINQIVITWLLPVSLLTYYSGSFDTSNKMWLIPRNILSPIFPLWTELKAQNDIEKITILFQRTFKFIVILVFPLTLILFFDADLILRFWISQEFSQTATPIFKILIIGIGISGVTYCMVPLSYAFNLPKIVTLFQFIQAIISTALSIVLTSKFGIIGAAYSFTVSLILIQPILTFMVLKKTIDKSFSFFIEKQFINTWFIILFSIITYGFTNYLLERNTFCFLITKASIFVIMYILAIVYWGFDDEDKRYLRKYTPLGKIFPGVF